MNIKLFVRFAIISFVVGAPVLAANARPVPRPALLECTKSGLEVYGIVHWGLNTYTDREWGYGDEDPKKLNPDSFDADQIVGACKDGGLQGLIVVAKHHDGFCLWPTKTTGRNITKRRRDGEYACEVRWDHMCGCPIVSFLGEDEAATLLVASPNHWDKVS